MQDAADLLGTTVDGIRSRIKRGTLDSMKVNGQVFVLLDPNQSGLGETSPDQPRPDPTSRDGEALLAAKDETISHLRRELDARNEELRRKDTIIMTLAQRVPELEASQDVQEDAQEPRHGTGGVEDGERAEKRPWWRRMFG